MSHVFHRNLRSQYPTAVKGEGVYLIDSDGKYYLDACGGAAVSCLGHSDPVVIEALKLQTDKICYAHSGFFTTEPMEELADFLASRSPKGLDYVYFVSGGSEAVESALKLARQYCVESGQSQRRHVIARRQSYHGNTLGALAAGGNAWRRAPFAPLLFETHHVSPCHAYRFQEDSETTAQYCQRLLNELEQKIIELGEDEVMAFIAEPIVGATMGAVPAVEHYFKGVRDICDRYDILLILDEVMCGMGRTGHLFAAEHEGVSPDLLCIAKGLGAGYQPIGATLVSDTIYQCIEQGSGFFQHGHTYIGHAMACAGALAVQQTIEKRDLLTHVQRQGMRLQHALTETFAEHPYVGDIRGRGLFLGMELVANKEMKLPFDPQLKMHARIKQIAMQNGLMCYPMGGTIDGRQGDHILLAPPFIIEDEHIDMIIEKLKETFYQVMKE
ncbi:aspartate aminotransferase family protein [Shewanella surugensis]|uniref:Aspartate aminotransferase family protein n=1 Tax=Shewanella surugensis TaxID=212020 RepID=A0ABT0LC15_9GAMM|nr:aspartate aminotransferase family protein [Shewanella surugensis]MCL1125231.1 aspartate aminotransferase family protein [Shewanella surugensis]